MIRIWSGQKFLPGAESICERVVELLSQLISMRNLIIIFSAALICSGCGTIASHNDAEGLSDTINHGVYAASERIAIG
jgi:hypothetical protein